MNWFKLVYGVALVEIGATVVVLGLTASPGLAFACGFSGGTSAALGYKYLREALA